MGERETSEPQGAVVLASASPRRRDLLRLLGISFSIQSADVDEEPLPGEVPEALARRLARAKALAISRDRSGISPCNEFSDTSQLRAESRCCLPVESSDALPRTPPDAVVLGADTIVVLDEAILGKPADDAEAMAMLGALRGRAHRVLTGVALAVAGEIVWTGLLETKVWMRQYGADEVERYVRSGSPLDKAGAYGIQDIIFRPVALIEGCFTNVVGLPLCEVRRALAELDLGRRLDSTAEARESSPGRVDESESCRLCELARGY